MATEQEVRAKAKSLGLDQTREDRAVELAKGNANLTVDQVIAQVQ